MKKHYLVNYVIKNYEPFTSNKILNSVAEIYSEEKINAHELIEKIFEEICPYEMDDKGNITYEEIAIISIAEIKL